MTTNNIKQYRVANKVLLTNLMDQTNDMRLDLVDLENETTLFKSKQDRTNARLEHEIAWIKFYLGVIVIFDLITTLGDIIGIW